jgi:hypothetical protein
MGFAICIISVGEDVYIVSKIQCSVKLSKSDNINVMMRISHMLYKDGLYYATTLLVLSSLTNVNLYSTFTVDLILAWTLKHTWFTMLKLIFKLFVTY